MPNLTSILTSQSQLKFSLFFVISTALGFISIPIALRLFNLHSIRVVPPPTNWSNTKSFSFEYLKIIFLAMYGEKLPRYFAS